MFMACCFRVNTKSPSGLNAKVGGREEDVLSGLSRKVSSSPMLLTSRNEGEMLQPNNLKCFTFNEVKNATRNFHPDGLVGEGGFGCVFKGWVDEHTLAPTKPGVGFVIAVKRVNLESSYQRDSEWLTEINYLGQLHHPNLVKLIGYCLEADNRILVYEFLTKGSLDNHLFRKISDFPPLSWKIRLKIALDAAKGLAFLHNDEVEVIYRDFKTSKILIDSNYNAKLSIFGLEKDKPEDDMIDSEMVYRMDTPIYIAPEHMAAGQLTKKSDVYNFGIVLLEIMLGKQALVENRPWENNLVEWAKPLLISKRKISQVMDVDIKGQYSSREAMKVAYIVIQCLSEIPRCRPSISEVVKLLEQLQDSQFQHQTTNHID